jgi:hypothetical protein
VFLGNFFLISAEMKHIYLKCFLLTVSVFLIDFLFRFILNIDNLLQNSLTEKLTKKELVHYFAFQDKWQWVTYVFVPLLIFVKTAIITSVLYISTYFFSTVAVTFKQLWAMVVQAELIFLLVPVFKIGWFYFFQTNYTLEDIQYFMPLSAINITGYHDLATWFIYPMQVLNVFELVYIVYLSYQIGYLTQTNADRGLKIVGTSYLPALLLWVVVVMFFTLNYS